MTREFDGGKSLQLLKGDITTIPVDAIVNAANSGLRGGGGVDGAIHAAAGPALRIELDEIVKKQGGCETGSAVATTGGNLPAKYVFHAVGPIYQDGKAGEPELLKSAYRTCLELAETKGVSYISFPSISTGVYGYPVQAAAPIALGEAVSHLSNASSAVQKVIFVLFDDRTLQAYTQALRELITICHVTINRNAGSPGGVAQAVTAGTRSRVHSEHRQAGGF
jgi:O-acetyl-ADP-ribose deacetylase